MAVQWKKWFSSAQVLAGVAALGLSLPALGTEYIVKLKGDASAVADVVTQKSIRGLAVLDSHSQGGLIKVDISDKSLVERARRLADLMAAPEVEYVVENFTLHALDMPNDPEIAKQWHLDKVKAFKAWDNGVGSRRIVIAVSDTGVDYKHPDIKDNVWTNTKEIPNNGVDDDNNGYVDDIHGYDFRGNDNDPMDETSSKNPGHGTHCAGIMGAVGNNGTFGSGMSQQVSIMPVRFLGSDGSGDLMGAVKSMDYATNNGANIISASWGAAVQEAQAKPIVEAIARANAKGVIFVAAASNDGKNNDSYSVFPANTNLPNMITVAASGPEDEKPSWSNFGRGKVHLASPGLNIFSTLPQEKFGKLSGTSMATPLVSGLVALLLSHNDKLTAQQVRAILQATGSKTAIETACDCRIDANEAVHAVRSDAFLAVPQAATLKANDTLQFGAIGGKGPYSFKSSNDAVAGISSTGMLTAKKEGETTVVATDASGATNTSLKIRVVSGSSTPPPGGQECPLGDPQLCQLLCAIQPTLPWCNGN